MDELESAISRYVMKQVAHLIIEDLWCYIDEFISDRYFKEQTFAFYTDIRSETNSTIYIARNEEKYETFLHNDDREVYHFHAEDCLSIIMNYDKHLNECKKNVRRIIEKEFQDGRT